MTAEARKDKLLVDLRQIRLGLTRDTWCQLALATDAIGNSVSTSDKDASRWCLLGHCYRVRGVVADIQPLRRALVQAAKVLGHESYLVDYEGALTLSAINDRPGATISEMQAIVDRAIVSAGG